MRTGDQTLMKEINKSIVTDIIRSQHPVSRARISEITGLNKATVSSLIDELIHEGLVIELGTGPSAVGRRPRMLGFNGRAGYAVGVAIDLHEVRFLLIDLLGKLEKSLVIASPVGMEVEQTVYQVVDVVQQIVQSAPSSPLGVIGVGIAVPGLVDFKKGVVWNAPNLHWMNIPLRKMLEAHLDLPVFIDNESNMGAIAEQWLGKGQNYSNFVYLSVTTGLGSGIVVNRQLMRGSGGIAGEVGHMVVVVDGLLCSCGNRGCLEMYASEKSLIEIFQQKSGKEISTVEEIFQRAENGDVLAKAAISSVGRYLATGMNNLIHTCNPESVIVGGRITRFQSLLWEAMQPVLSKSMVDSFFHTKLEWSTLGQNAISLGAASLVIDHRFAKPTIL